MRSSRHRASRHTEKNPLHYGDFRDFADVGGKREPLIAEGEKRATTDSDIAQKLASDRVKELEAKRRNRTILGVVKETSLSEFASHHLVD